METKKCRVCKQTKDVSEYGRLRGGYAYECRVCKKKLGKEYRRKFAEQIKAKKSADYLKNAEAIKAKSKSWYENNKERAAEAVKAYRDARPGWRAKYRREWYLRNRARVLEQAREYRAQNRQAVTQLTKDWFKKHPWKRNEYSHARRARISRAGGRFTTSQIDDLRRKQRGRCACCKAKLADLVEHIDHIHPLALGGNNDILNIQLLCQKCNCSKHARHPIDFMQQNGYLL